MAEFCKACASELFGPDPKFNDAEGLTKKDNWEEGYAVAFLCESCGYIQVDPEGNCVSKNCLEKGKPGHGLPWKL